MSFAAVSLGDGLTIRQFETADEQAVFAAAEDFAALTGDRSQPADVQSLFYVAPEGVSPDTKEILAIERDGEVIGLIDTVPGYPNAESVALGTFVLDPDHRCQGVGTAVLRALLIVARERGLRTVPATTPAQWQPGIRFLETSGFVLSAPQQASTGSANRVVQATEKPMVQAHLRFG